MTAQPLDKLLAEMLLTLGMFVKQGDGIWTRQVDDGAVKAWFENDEVLKLNITPNITQPIHHEQRRIAAGVYFEIACKYAEKAEAKLTQHSNITGCIEQGSRDKVLAHYPLMPLDWTKVCNGFQAVLLSANANETPRN